MRATHEQMTKVGANRNNHLSIQCRCSHVGLIPVQAFTDEFGPDMSVHEAVTKTRFTKCGASVRAGNPIIYVGNSEFAITGSRTVKESDKDSEQLWGRPPCGRTRCETVTFYFLDRTS